MVSVVIPAFNEVDTIAGVIASARQHPRVEEVIVVDDGSGDATTQVAEAAGARVIRLDRNAGKTAALDAGVRSAKADILLFLDADVTGHTQQTLSQIMQPVIEGRFEMNVGLRARSTLMLNRALRYFPIIGGDRALTRRLWEAIPANGVDGFEIEIVLNYTSKQFEKGMGFELVYGTSHRIKEKKYGVALGAARRAGMIGAILSISFRLYILGWIIPRAVRVKERLTTLVRASANGKGSA
ncbi:glycosyltransferase involved in cell wall biosynthesis [Natronocella acetinitrilica]|uniref:Glycosyltransferase involved in cell wall biosynthesis n=1 Tax=Natronocella acetinitrilica TaxID=414046 RepID=A0AAE3KCT9_9GAMM|nr:glycosyltransferase family 2 protein [Natronocella acetinitrilica]MCP1675423.1 glycosyltransferase involved in cell wall biosynthesis [Natronocella acetinitrilica]